MVSPKIVELLSGIKATKYLTPLTSSSLLIVSGICYDVATIDQLGNIYKHGHSD